MGIRLDIGVSLIQSPGQLLLRAYYERLYERLETGRARLVARIDELLRAEIARRRFSDFDEEKLAAYREACLAFVDERAEGYNPFGIQYTFERTRSHEAAELEFQLNWYDSREEFELLVTMARALADHAVPDAELPLLADELIRRAGAFPDGSIIDAYLAAPALQKLPDYIVATAIEEVVCNRTPQS
jgi:hypothetical protein